MAHNWKTAPLKPEDEDKPAFWKLVSVMNENEKKEFFAGLSLNHQTSMEFVFANESMPWRFDYLSENVHLTWEMVETHLDKEWDFMVLLQHDDIPFELILDALKRPINQHMERHRNEWEQSLMGIQAEDRNPIYFLQCRKDLTWEIIQSHPEIPWIYREMIAFPFITWDIIRNNMHLPWILETEPQENLLLGFGNNPNCSLEIKKTLVSNPKFYTRYYNFVKFEFVKNHPDWNWKWDALAKLYWITGDDIASTPEFPWSLASLCTYVSDRTSWDLIFSNSHLPWNQHRFNYRRDLTWDIISSHPDLPWKFSYLSGHHCITMDIIKANSHHPWDFRVASLNRSITWDDVWENRHEDWVLESLGGNSNDSFCVNTTGQMNYVFK